MKTLCSYLVDTPLFFEHYCKYMMIDNDVYNRYQFTEKEEEYIHYINETYKINIRPYMYIINDSELKHDFFLYFNKYRDVQLTNSNKDFISDITNIKDLHELLSLIFFVQYYFL